MDEREEPPDEDPTPEEITVADDPSEAAKWATADPNIYPEIVV